MRDAINAVSMGAKLPPILLPVFRMPVAAPTSVPAIWIVAAQNATSQQAEHPSESDMKMTAVSV